MIEVLQLWFGFAIIIAAMMGAGSWIVSFIWWDWELPSKFRCFMFARTVFVGSLLASVAYYAIN